MYSVSQSLARARRAWALGLCLVSALVEFAMVARAQLPPPPDYTNALWSQAYTNHWYTSRPGHYFCVIHDMEGYYEATISYFQQASTQASIYYCVNSLQNGDDAAHGYVENNPNDAPAGEITQQVREAYWAWHVICWNGYMFGTEHEGFVDSPAWYSEAMYQASAKLQQHLCNAPNSNTAPIPEDRNHIIGHNEWQNPAWTAWMATNWPVIDTTCNDHTDPGQYWNWPHFMQLVCLPTILTQPASQSAIVGSNVTFSVATYNTGTNNPTAYQWLLNGTNLITGATNASLILTNVQLADSGTYAVALSNAYNLVLSSNAVLIVAHVITNLAVVPRPHSAIITWNTDGPATSQVAYGPTPSYGFLSPLDTNLVTDHAVLITGLASNTIYYFSALSGVGGVTVNSPGTFSTDISVTLQTPQGLYTGVWVNDSSAPDRLSPTYKYAATVSGADSATAIFRPGLPLAAQYDVYLWYSAAANRSAFAPASAAYPDGSFSTSVNETAGGGSWHLLAGNLPFNADTNSFVRLGNGTGEANKIVIADAVRWIYTPAQDLPANGLLPSWWYDFYFGGDIDFNDASPGANGYTLLQNFILGLSPVDPDANFNFAIVPARSGFQAVFSPWFGGRNYQLQAATNLANPVWASVPNESVTQTNGQGVINYTNSGVVPTYYRLSVQLAQ